MIAWRGVIDATQLPREYTARRVQLWMGPGAHLVAYPVSGARRINIVAIVPGTWNRPGWSAPGDGQELRNIFNAEKWPGPARMMLGAVDNWRRWALFTLPEDGQWTRGAIALLGDAAHAMLPFAAQGAAMAIEDAAVMARALSDGPMETTANVTAAFKRYARARRSRVAQMQRAARKAAQTFHLSGPMAAARDFTIRLLGPRRMLARQHWIYDWRA
jgi:salicylate hydroxylase